MKYGDLAGRKKPNTDKPAVEEPKVDAPSHEEKTIVDDKSTSTTVKPSKGVQYGINIPSYQSTNIPTTDEGIIEIIHKAMRQSPSAAASYRLSPMEKKRLEVALFNLKMRSTHSPELDDIKTNENEVVRIAVNYVLNDLDRSGNESVLVRALTSLRA